MINKKFFTNYYLELSNLLMTVDFEALNNLSDAIKNAHQQGNKIILAGNGGSASIASHASVDLTKSSKIRAINFNEPNLITCFANDFGYEHWISQGLIAFADKGDLIILISSSGQSKNMINGAKTARELGCKIVTFSGFLENNPLKQLGHINFYVNSTSYNYVEMAHYIWLLSSIDLVSQNQSQ